MKVLGRFGKVAEVWGFFSAPTRKGGDGAARARRGKLCFNEKQINLCFPGALTPFPMRSSALSFSRNTLVLDAGYKDTLIDLCIGFGLFV